MPAGDLANPTGSSLLLGAAAADSRLIGGTSGGDLYTFAHRTLTTQRDATANDSDKTFTVPAGRLWWVHYIYVLLVTTATVGTRRIEIILSQDGTNDSYVQTTTASQAASLTRHYNFLPGSLADSFFANGTIGLHIPQHTLLPPAGTVRIHDTAAVDAAADDMTVVLTYDEITV